MRSRPALDPLAVYETLLRDPGARRGARLRRADGTAVALELNRWLAEADDVDRAVLTGLRGPVLDIGCGPGRHLRALDARGIAATGIDVSPAAVAHARGAGSRAMRRSVFEPLHPLPDAGGWTAALLLDDNLGIGGAPERLLRRAQELLAPGGTLIVELAGPGAGWRSCPVRFEHAGGHSAWFRWAAVGVDDLDALLGHLDGLALLETHSAGTRWFARLERLPRELPRERSGRLERAPDLAGPVGQAEADARPHR